MGGVWGAAAGEGSAEPGPAAGLAPVGRGVPTSRELEGARLQSILGDDANARAGMTCCRVACSLQAAAAARVLYI